MSKSDERMPNHRYFSGRGKTQSNNLHDLPVIDPAQLTSPENYLASEGLASAVETALTLGMPLLLTGEPGCGKSQLAYRVAWELGFPGHPSNDPNQDVRNPIRFQVKSTTESKDLFYTYDTVGRFHAAHFAKSRNENSSSDNQGSHSSQSESNTKSPPISNDMPDNGTDRFEPISPEHYITYQALGLAILRAKGQQGLHSQGVDSKFISDRQLGLLNTEQERSIVLLDEIDKAPRDVPNDILNEIEALEFSVPELNLTKPIRIEEDENAFRPIVIITSNSERDLPEAFLRRCVYYHVEFPPFTSDRGDELTVENIVLSRLGDRYSGLESFIREGLELVAMLRDDVSDLNKRPGIAEILNWFDYLSRKELRGGLKDVEAGVMFDSVKNTLLKTSEDQKRTGELLSRIMGS